MGGYGQLSPMHMSNNRKYEVQRAFQFKVVLEKFSEDLILAVLSINLPEVSNEVIQLPYGNTSVKVPGQAAVADGTFVIRDFIYADTEAQINEWRFQVYNPHTDNMGHVDEYKRSGTVFLCAPDGTFVRSWNLLGVWPTSINYGELSYENGTATRQLTMNLSYDKAVPGEKISPAGV